MCVTHCARFIPIWRLKSSASPTQGDRTLDVPLATEGGKGLFLKELEKGTFDGRHRSGCAFDERCDCFLAARITYTCYLPA
ncbi:MAG: hypothetical protein Ct9H300mP14_14180 [Gammaproteobacteria bacterium]|nr:MAG: hypothetical protein Ct9H300mP14_14180 [Gammaproteobacteria bacterium]